MAIGAVVQDKTALKGAATSNTITLDSAVAAGNMLVLYISIDGDTNTHIIPAGWTAGTTDTGSSFMSVTSCYKVAEVGDEGPWTISWTNSQESNLYMVEMSGVSVLDSKDTYTSGGSSTTTVTLGPLTPSETETFAISLFSADSRNNWETPNPQTYNTSMTQYSRQSTTGLPVNIVGTEQLTTANEITVTATTTDTGDQAAGIMYIFGVGATSIINQIMHNRRMQQG